MKIYLSIPKGLDIDFRRKVIQALQSHTCTFFRGGTYDSRIVTNATTSILLLIGEEVETVGRGQYDEGNRGALAGQKIKALYYNPDTNLFNIYEIEDMQELDPKTWQRWASIDLTKLAEYTAIELDDYYSNYENI